MKKDEGMNIYDVAIKERCNAVRSVAVLVGLRKYADKLDEIYGDKNENGKCLMLMDAIHCRWASTNVSLKELQKTVTRLENENTDLRQLVLFGK